MRFAPLQPRYILSERKNKSLSETAYKFDHYYASDPDCYEKAARLKIWSTKWAVWWPSRESLEKRRVTVNPRRAQKCRKLNPLAVKRWLTQRPRPRHACQFLRAPWRPIFRHFWLESFFYVRIFGWKNVGSSNIKMALIVVVLKYASYIKCFQPEKAHFELSKKAENLAMADLNKCARINQQSVNHWVSTPFVWTDKCRILAGINANAKF